MRGEQLQSTEFLKKVFSEFYIRETISINPPSAIERREFGFLSFVEGRMFRHKRFDSGEELRSFLENTSVSDAYYSCAYYTDPEAEMEKKGWNGADLIFDIDADHIPTDCNKIHDEWNCNDCAFAGKGITPEKCPVCGGQRFKVNTWPCEICLESAKTEALKLLDMLMTDFGFPEKGIKLFFSGHRGYHVHVEDEAVMMLDSIARKEIVDYVCGLGIDIAFKGLKDLSINNSGWHGRIARGLYNLILNAKDYEKIGLRKNVVEILVKNKDILLNNLENGKGIDVVKGVGSKNWKKIIEFCANHQAAKVDTVVTTDIHRLIRLPNTLHSKTGLKKVEVPISNIKNFDPFKSAVAFKEGTATIFVSDAPEFRLGDEIFGPYKNQKVELPSAAAALLICKGRAEVID